MNLVKTLIVLAAGLCAFPAVAGPYGTALSTCLADNTSGKERKELARWVFVAISAHPDMRDLSSATLKTRDEVSQSMGTLVTRLLAERCSEQTRTAVQKEGSDSLKLAFEFLGKLAMQELVTNNDVNTSISAFERYLDRKKIESALAAK